MKFTELQTAMMTAMKEKNKIKKNVIADIITCAKNMAIEENCKDNISEEIIAKAILKSKKVCQEQINTCPKNRPDLLETFELCMTYINEFAPKMMSEEEVKEQILLLMAFNNLTRENSKGQIMKVIMPKLKGKAEGQIINKIVTDIITGE